jgi:hypothetical protein
MPTYNVDVIHEPTGTYMNFQYESDQEENEVWREILSDISIVAFNTSN